MQSRLLRARPLLLALGSFAAGAALGTPTLAQSQAGTGGPPRPDASAPQPNPAPTLTGTGRADRTQPNERAAGVTLEEVTITARKRNERLIDVPVAANALGPTQLDRYAITDLQNISTQVPQVSIQRAASGNGAIITVRGVGSPNIDASIEQEVTVNIDGVPISRGRVIQQAFFDQQAIEILKGPQALYFGKNSPAGVISISSVNPGPTFGGYGRVGYELETDQYYGEFALNLPITDTLRARVAFRGSKQQGGFTRSVGGPITNPAQLPAYLALSGQTLPGPPFKEYPGVEELVLRATVLWRPNDKFDLLAKFLVSNQNDRGDSMAGRPFSCGPTGLWGSVDIGQVFGAPPPVPGRPPILIDPFSPCSIRAGTNSYGTIPPGVAKNYRGSNGGVPFTQVLSYLGSLTANYRLTDKITLTSVTGYYKYRQLQWSNYDSTIFSAASGQNNDYNESITQEVRLVTSFNAPLNATLGAFYSHDDRRFYQAGSIGYFFPDPATGKTDLFESDDFFKTDTYSVFGELNLKLPHNLELAGGMRYSQENKSADLGSTFMPLPLGSPAGKRITGEFTEDNVSPQVTLSWKPVRNTLIYGAYKTGFKSGGYSAPALIPVNANNVNQRFGQETVEGGEIGAKVSNLWGRLTADLTAYRYTYTGLQLTAFDAPTTSYFTQNAASATTEGVELNANFRLTEALSLRGSAAYNRARYDDFPSAQCWAGQPLQVRTTVGAFTPGLYDPTTLAPLAANNPYVIAAAGRYCQAGFLSGAMRPVAVGQSLTGLPLARAPEWSLSAGASYERPVFGDWSLGLTADARYQSGYFITTNASPFSYQGGFYLFDLSARLYNAQWEVALIGRNISDTAYAVTGGDKPLGLPGNITAGVGTPRQIYLQLTRRF